MDFFKSRLPVLLAAKNGSEGARSEVETLSYLDGSNKQIE